MLISREVCKMRHENGNCLPCGGFCLAVNPVICESVQNGYDMGMRDGITSTMYTKSMVIQKHGRWGKTYVASPSYYGLLNGWECSRCGFSFEDRSERVKAPEFVKYCPNCGARMDGET